MTHDKDDRKRPHLRLVVDNAEKRLTRSGDGEAVFLPFAELHARHEELKPLFYQDIDPWQERALMALERFFVQQQWPYGLDPHHGRLVVLPARVVCPTAELGQESQDEVFLYVAENSAGHGLCLSLEMIMPFWSDDDSVMEDALLFGPIHQYGTLFLEENKGDGYLDLVYRLAFPLYPPALTMRLLTKLFTIAGHELTETLRILADYPEA
ncbi:MAG TPA: hypothetical protein VIU41_15510 [Geobacteraceae bacterium]